MDRKNKLLFDTEDSKQNRCRTSNDDLRQTITTLERTKLVAHQISDDLDSD